MKNIISLLVLILLLVPVQQADAQGFLKKALNKAKELTKSTSVQEEDEDEEDTPTLRNAGSRNTTVSDDADDIGVASAKEQLQPKRQSTLTWDEAVVPSTASSAEALMKELPAVPTVAQLVEPNEDAQILYYRAIKKVSLRAEQLNEDATCDDETTQQWRNKANQVLKDLGLSDADIKALENDNLSDAEREHISQKVAKAILGDIDVKKLENMDANNMDMNQINDLMNNVNQMRGKMAGIQQTQQAMNRYVNQLKALMPTSDLSAGNVSFADSERKKVEDLKKQIYSTDNASVYNPLYLQALELIKTYRQRVAKLWHDDLEKRVNQLKQNMPEAISIQRQAIRDELIPECALWRVPLNLVIQATDVLGEAYAEFPSNYPPMYNEEVVGSIELGPGEGTFTYAESRVAGSLDDALSGKGIYRIDGDIFYEWKNGRWEAIDNEAANQEMKTVDKPESASWQSQDGKREVRFNAEGGFISLPEGDEVSPIAWVKNGNSIIWVDYVISESQAGGESLQIKKCTYKL